MSKEIAIKAIAEYLTGPSNGNHSVGLEVGGIPRKNAERFFDLKKKLIGNTQDEGTAVFYLTELLK